MVADSGRLPVPNFAAGGVATPADASLMMQLGAEAVFVGSGIFKSGDPVIRGKAIVEATTHYEDPDVLRSVCEGICLTRLAFQSEAESEHALQSRNQDTISWDSKTRDPEHKQQE